MKSRHKGSVHGHSDLNRRSPAVMALANLDLESDPV